MREAASTARCAVVSCQVGQTCILGDRGGLAAHYFSNSPRHGHGSWSWVVDMGRHRRRRVEQVKVFIVQAENLPSVPSFLLQLAKSDAHRRLTIEVQAAASAPRPPAERRCRWRVAACENFRIDFSTIALALATPLMITMSSTLALAMTYFGFGWH